jgi:hypothetical protein
MSSLFRKPQAPATPTIVQAPPPPTIDQAITDRNQNDRMLRRRGRAATMLTGPEGAGVPQTATKQLLGQ